MQVVKAPTNVDLKGKVSVFLAGSIEMGKAIDWQKELVELLQQLSSADLSNVVVLNPRRDDWDSSWKQDLTDSRFVEQVSWELKHQDQADILVFFFSPDTKSPITLLELGLALGRFPEKSIVCCPPGFWRKGNVDVSCLRYGAEQAINVCELAVKLGRRIEKVLVNKEK